MTITAEVRTTIAAPPDRVYDLVSDVTRMGEWSPETSACEWVDGVGPVVGAKFRGHNAAGKAKWSTTCRVDVADPGREFTFSVIAPMGSMVFSTWSYRLTPDGDGTELVESMEGYRRSGALKKLISGLVTGVKDRAAHNLVTMEETLRRIKAAAEASG